MSIRRTLLLSLLGGLFACAIVITFVVYFNTAREMRELFSNSMKQMANITKDQAFVQNDAQQNSAAIDPEELEESTIIQIWDSNGKLLHSSSPEIGLPFQANDGFGTVTVHEQKWKTYRLKANNNFIQIAQPRHMIVTMVEESAANMLMPFAILFLLLGISTWIIVGKSLLPLSHLSKLIAKQNIDQLKPVSMAEIPNEVVPVVTAFNELLKRLEQAMALQRQFTADAAHELRTPLAAIKIQAGLLDRAKSQAERSDATKKLSAGIDRSIHLAEQLLNASRSSAVNLPAEFRPVYLDRVIELCIETLAPIASLKNIIIATPHRDECIIEGDEEGIRMLILNLIDNAVRYTPNEGAVNVNLRKHGDSIVFEVEDSGIGIPVEHREKIFRRFYRIPGNAEIGAGLGLSIVKDIANNHNATVLVTDGHDKKGTVFRVIFLSNLSEQAA